MKLWVDDLRIPPSPSGDEEPWVVVKTIGAAIRHLRTGTVTHLALDHDLGGRREGRRVSQWVERKAVEGKLPRLKWQVLSDNPAGREEIYTGLHRASQVWWRQWADSLPDPGTGILACMFNPYK